MLSQFFQNIKQFPVLFINRPVFSEHWFLFTLLYNYMEHVNFFLSIAVLEYFSDYYYFYYLRDYFRSFLSLIMFILCVCNMHSVTCGYVHLRLSSSGLQFCWPTHCVQMRQCGCPVSVDLLIVFPWDNVDVLWCPVFFVLLIHDKCFCLFWWQAAHSRWRRINKHADETSALKRR